MITRDVIIKIVTSHFKFLGDWPWMAAIGYRVLNSASFNYKWLCGGSLISNRYVITAAHCAVGLGNLSL